MMKELSIGICPICNDVMYDICVHCGSYKKLDNCMQVTVALDNGMLNVIPFCSKHVRSIDIPTAQSIFDMGIVYCIKNGLPANNASAKVVKILKKTITKQSEVK